MNDARRALVIDTSVQVQRLLLQVEEQARMEEVITCIIPLTTETTFRELFAGLVKAFRFVVSALLDRRGLDAASALGEIQKGAATMKASDRERAKVLLVIALLIPSCGSAMLAGDLAAFAEDELRRMQEHGFFVFGTRWEDRRDVRSYGGHLAPLDCSVAQKLVDEGRSIPTCSKTTRSCRVRSFLGNARNELSGCAETLPVDKGRHRDTLELLARKDDEFWQVVDDSAIGQRLCWPIGDTLITLECPPGRMILTSDRDFIGISARLGRGCVLLTKDSTPASVEASVMEFHATSSQEDCPRSSDAV